MDVLRELDETIGAEKVLKIKHRMLAVCSVLRLEYSTEQVAEIGVTDRCVGNWVAKFKDAAKALRDLFKSGRPHLLVRQNKRDHIDNS